MMNPLSIFPSPELSLNLEGFSIGHGTDLRGKTGVTVILSPEGALAAAELRGSATGTRQIDSLISPHHVASRAHGVVLAGGSGFGLDAATPVVAALEAAGKGFQTGYRPVPLVPTAILFDLAFGDAGAAPTPALVKAALASALGTGAVIPSGSVGAGTGATVGKALGPEKGMKGGFGFASLTSLSGGAGLSGETGGTGVTVAAAVAVNAFGDVRDPETGRRVAGCRESESSTRLVGADRVMAALSSDFGHTWEGNTTLAVVLTDADLPKASLFKVCQMAFGGFYRCFEPALSLYDGDVVMVLSSGRRRAHVNQVGFLAQRAVEAAILRAVREADGFGLLPAAKDLGTT